MALFPPMPGQSPVPVGYGSPADAPLVPRPVELRLATGAWFTLWNPGWAEPGTGGTPFLGDDEFLYAFRSAAELAGYAASADSASHGLGAHPLWPDVRLWSVPRFVPAADDVYELSAPETLADGRIDKGEVVRFVESALVLDDLAAHLGLDYPLEDDRSYQRVVRAGDRATGLLRGGELRAAVCAAAQAHWPLVVHRAAMAVKTPSAGGDDGGASPRDAAAPRAAVPLERLVDAEVLWLGLLGEGCYVVRVRPDPAYDPWFVGAAGSVDAAPDVDALADHLASGRAADLPGAPPWPQVIAAGADLEPYEDAVYDLDELGSRIAPGMTRVDGLAMLDARLLLLDLARWCGAQDVLDALEEHRPLGRFLVGVVPDVVHGTLWARGRVAGTEVERVREAWDEVVAALGARLHRVDG